MLAVPLLIRFVQRLVHSLSNCCSTPPADTQFSLFHGFLGKSETKLSPCEVHRVVIRANGEVPMDFLESEESQLAAAGKDSHSESIASPGTPLKESAGNWNVTGTKRPFPLPSAPLTRIGLPPAGSPSAVATSSLTVVNPHPVSNWKILKRSPVASVTQSATSTLAISRLYRREIRIGAINDIESTDLAGWDWDSVRSRDKR